MKNPVAQSIADFLKHFPPFGLLENTDLLNIAERSRIIYLDKNQTLFKGGDSVSADFYVIKSGSVGLSITSDAEETLIDKCDEGDILGLRPYFAKEDYLMTAKSREESIICSIPIAVFEPYIVSNSSILSFFLESFASQTRNPYDKERKGKLMSENMIVSDQVADLQYYQPIKYTKNPITANADDILRFIAKTMANSAIGSVIIEENQLPIGIITDRDLRTKIATGQYPIETDARSIMKSPVITVPENISVAEAQMVMLKHDVGHLCVTKDGTNKSVITGIISEHDVIAAQSNTPGVLLKQTRRASNAKELKYVREKITDLIQNSIDTNIPISHISNIVAEINIELTRRAIELSVEKMGTPPPVLFTWVNIGSQGRKEQLLKTDQDNAIIFEDVEPEAYDNVKTYFLELAENVNEILEKVGYEPSPNGLLASNSLWCKSLSGWIKQYNSWINTPAEKGVELSTAFYDFDFIYGAPDIEDALLENIRHNMGHNKKFFGFLAADTLKNPPPLGFFRQFLLESDGEHKDSFDIKGRALEPLIDAARVLALSHNLFEITNTYHRFKKLAELEPKHTELYEECAEAFNTLMRFRTEEGLINDSDGRYLNMNELSKSDKVKLKNSIEPINEVQDIIKNRFPITYIN
ncbi:MAG: nucleotidyltransferase [Flavobacterium psychrophilum]|nr:MAG: nucleotidyltransferase [Flavobacterium psychrophilum]